VLLEVPEGWETDEIDPDRSRGLPGDRLDADADRDCSAVVRNGRASEPGSL
jgi:hypothetical protein